VRGTFIQSTASLRERENVKRIRLIRIRAFRKRLCLIRKIRKRV
jgi:hypothetical protein